MTVHDSSTLAALIAAYDKSVVFEESAPGALRIAKALPELRWSNGGLLLLGVRKDGSIVGIQESEVDEIFDKFARLCGELSKASSSTSSPATPIPSAATPATSNASP
jgi:predicted HTH transcriptional regulator